MALTAPTADLTGNTIASTYDQLLILDNAAGIVENTLKIVSTQLGRSALQLDDEKVLIKGVDTSNAAAFEVQQTGGTSIFKVAAGTPAVTINAATVTLTQDTNFVLTGGLNGMSIDGTTFSVDGSNNRVGIGTTAPSVQLDIESAASTHCVLDLNAATSNYNTTIDFQEAGNSRASVSYDSSEDELIIRATSGKQLRFDTGGTNERMTILSTGLVGIGTDAPAALLELDQLAVDTAIMKFVSSDVAHGMTDIAETDCFGMFSKNTIPAHAGTAGGLLITGLQDADGINPYGAITLRALNADAGDTTHSATGYGAVRIIAQLSDGAGDVTPHASNTNLFTVENATSGGTKFIVDKDGDLFCDGGSSSTNVTTYDDYDDAQLVRTLDLSYGEDGGLINSKFDEFIKYNHEKLAELDLVGREEDGTPNHFVNVTGMQRLHNGAIWQQYTEMQKMKELMYDAMVELMGKEKADKQLDSHDIKLLDKDLLN